MIVLQTRRVEIQQALSSDFGCHPTGSSDVIETLGPAGRAAFVASKLSLWMEDDKREVDPALYGDATAYIHYEPKGVVANIIPFNFPFDLSVRYPLDSIAALFRALIAIN